MRGPEAPPFLASNGWLHTSSPVAMGSARRSWLGKFGLPTTNARFPPELRAYSEEHNLPDEAIFNTDETALYYRLLPIKSLAVANSTTRPMASSRAKIEWLLLTTNKTGTNKLKPLVVGRFKNPRCLHHINRDTLPVQYTHSRNAWMTSAFFETWFQSTFVLEFRKHLHRQGLQPRAVLLFDTCPAHPSAETVVSRNVKMSKIQPLQQEIIQNVKMSYRKELMRMILDKPDISLPDALKQTNFHLLHTAWRNVTATSIENCWTHALGDAFTTPTHDIAEDNDGNFLGYSEADVTEADTAPAGSDGPAADQLLLGDGRLGHGRHWGASRQHYTYGRHHRGRHWARCWRQVISMLLTPYQLWQPPTALPPAPQQRTSLQHRRRCVA